MIEIFHSLKCSEIINEFRKTFSIGENGKNSYGVLPIPQNVRPPKSPEDTYF